MVRRYDEPIEVRSDRIRAPDGGDDVGPAQFIWRRRLWKVLEVETRWYETADWWTKPEADLLAEQEVWRVVAADGRGSQPGVYELACGPGASGGRRWLLRGVVD